MSVLIKNGRIVTAVDDYIGDIFVNGSTVALIGKEAFVSGLARALSGLPLTLGRLP